MHFFSTVFRVLDFYGRVEIETYDIYMLSKLFFQRKKIQNGQICLSPSSHYDFTLRATQRQRRRRDKIMSPLLDYRESPRLSLYGVLVYSEFLRLSLYLIIMSPLASHSHSDILCFFFIHGLQKYKFSQKRFILVGQLERCCLLCRIVLCFSDHHEYNF